MSTPSKALPDRMGTGRNGSRRPVYLVLAAVVVGAVYTFWPEESGEVSSGTTFVARRGDLEITVLEGGSIEALKSQEIRSRVRDRQGVKIIEIVEEGYQVTEEDVANRKILVKLDSSDLEDRYTNQSIQFQGAEASYIEAQNAFDIQVSTNESEISGARLNVKFALMDFQKFLGEKAVANILSTLKLDEKAAKLKEEGRNLNKARLNLVVAPAVSPEVATQSGSYSRPESGPPPRGRGPSNGEGGGWESGKGAGEWRDRSPSGGGQSVKQGGSGIVMTEALMDAMAGAMKERGMPMDAGRFRQMLESQGVGKGEIPEEMVERMSQFGMDIRSIAAGLKGSKKSDGSMAAPKSPKPIGIKIDLEYLAARDAIDFSVYASLDRLEDGSAKQQLRSLQNDLLVAKENFNLNTTEFEGKQRLAEKGFVTQVELDREEARLERSRVDFEMAETALPLHIKYEFPKAAEEFLSAYEDSLMEMGRTMKEALSRLAQTEARMRKFEAHYGIERRKLEELQEQLDNCVIRAERPGLVVYGSSVGGNMFRGGSREPIQEGTSVRERQLIITIPDMTLMAARVKIHEASIQKITKGQRSRMIIDSRPDFELTGEVTKVNVMPDANDRWMNPDLKVFSTMVQIDGIHEWLRPGMSVQVEILVDRLEDVVYVPIQAISMAGDHRVVYVAENGTPVQRIVETGAFNQDFISIKSGLSEGEVIYLRAPDDLGTNTEGDSVTEDSSSGGQESAEAA